MSDGYLGDPAVPARYTVGATVAARIEGSQPWR
jgi:hypothetical protein